jgi:hypothetical protein
MIIQFRTVVADLCLMYVLIYALINVLIYALINVLCNALMYVLICRVIVLIYVSCMF